ncbi:hypothetical protein BCR32DRAFT_265473, partial [Anaeromyces robustus]
MHITEFEKLNYNYIIQELALRNDYGTLSRKSTLNELNVEEYNINKKINLQPLTKTGLATDVEKNNENDINEQDNNKFNKSFQGTHEMNSNKNENIDNFNKIDEYYHDINKNYQYQKNEIEKVYPNNNINNSKEVNGCENSSNKYQKKKDSLNFNNLNISESDEELYELDDDIDENENNNNNSNSNNHNNTHYNTENTMTKENNNFDEQDNNIFRRGQQKFLSSSNYKTKNMNRLYHLLNSVTPLNNNISIKNTPENWDEFEVNNEYNEINSNKQKAFKVLRFEDNDINKISINHSTSCSKNISLNNYVELSCKLLNSRIRLGKPIPIELEIINKGSNSIPYLKIVVSAITKNDKNESFCKDKVMFGYYLEPGNKCVKKFSLEPYLWDNEEDCFYDDVKSLNLNASLGSNTLYSISNLASKKTNILTNKNFSSYYYYSKLYARNKRSKNIDKEKVLKNNMKSLISLTNIFDLGIIADKDNEENKDQNEINYNAIRVIPKEANTMLNNLPSSIKINIYQENGELILCNNSEFNLKSEYFTQDFYLLGQYFKLNSKEENDISKNKSNKYRKYRKTKSYSLNILLVNSSVETKNKFIHSLEYALFVEKQLLSKNRVREFRDLLIENEMNFDCYKENTSKFYWSENNKYYQEIKMANHFPKNIKFYDCPCNDKINDEVKDISLNDKNAQSIYNKTFTKMNALFKNKFNVLPNTIDSEININTTVNTEKQSCNDKKYCSWLDGDEAELISKGELPLGKKILDEKIYYSDIEEDYYNDSIKRNPIHNIIYLFSLKQISDITSEDKENINNNINKLQKMKKTLNICIFIDDCNVINEEYNNINEY